MPAPSTKPIASGIESASRRFAILVNRKAAHGRALKALPTVERCAERLGLTRRVIVTSDAGHACEAAHEAAVAGEVVVAMGGDGMLGVMADALRGTDGVLGLLPVGRGNDFARVLGIPTELYEACRLLRDGYVTHLDLGEVNGRLFAGIATTGFDSVANEIANNARVIRGNLVYAYAGIRALAGWRPAHFRIVADGAERRMTGYTVAVANSPTHGGGMRVAPQACLDDGRLDIVTLGDVSKFKLLASLPKVFKGEHVALEEVDVQRARQVYVEADRPFKVFADGDPVAELPATIRSVPQSLRIIAPDPAAVGAPHGRTRPTA